MLNPRSREARRDVRSPYDMHRTLARAFPTPDGVNYRSEHGVLFRLEPRLQMGAGPSHDHPLSSATGLLVQSQQEPEWDRLPSAYLICPVITKAFNPSFSVGQPFAFRLVANPTRKVKRPGQPQGKRLALVDTVVENGFSPAREWFNRKGIQHGFEASFVLMDTFWLGKHSSDISREKQHVAIFGVRYDGLLYITDPAKFSDALKNGIGPSKAFGFGLLSLAKPT